MTLKYRGVSYEDNSPKLAKGAIKATGKYRGVDITFAESNSLPVPQPVHDLSDRSVAYQTGQAAPQPTADQPSLAIPPQAADSIQERSRRLMMKHHRAIERRELSMLSRLASEVGLKVDVGCYRNRIQGDPSSFAATYDRSPAAMS